MSAGAFAIERDALGEPARLLWSSSTPEPCKHHTGRAWTEEPEEFVLRCRLCSERLGSVPKAAAERAVEGEG